VPLNLAEGCKKASRKERARYLDIASGSAREVSAIFDVAAGFDGIDGAARLAGKDKCDHICAMLYKFR
jgi:four helix bundle protein